VTDNPIEVTPFLSASVSAPDDSGDPALTELIRDEIRRNGPITFARFMNRALYEPGLGYYATTDRRATRSGDFLTAPELHPIFGWTVARQIHEMWQRLGEPREFVLREYGAGTGSFGAAIGDGLRRDDPTAAESIDYQPIETPGRPGTENASGPMIGCVVANEFLDALPVHRVVNDGGRLKELLVDWQGGRFVEVLGEISDARIFEHVARGEPQLAEGQRTEVNLGAADWLRDVDRDLERGFVLLIDYGLRRAELRSADRSSGTLRAFRGQHVSSDILSGVGRRDLTAHVDLDALEEDARTAGFSVLGTTTQAEFLMGCGFDEVYAVAKEESDKDWEPALLLRSAVRRLLDPHHLGKYAVVVLGKDIPTDPPLRGLSFRTRASA
jgi:SAM-dependent MidA family methyltransferase